MFVPTFSVKRKDMPFFFFSVSSSVSPQREKKMLVCRPDCQSFPTKLRIYNTFVSISGPAWQQASPKPYLNVELHRPPFVIPQSSFWFAFLTFCVFLYCCLLAFAYHLNNPKPNRSSSHFYKLRLKFVTLYIHVNVNVWNTMQCRTLYGPHWKRKRPGWHVSLAM